MSFEPFNLDGLRCARRILTWAGNTKAMRWHEVNILMRAVVERERAFIACITKQGYTRAMAAKIAARPSRDGRARSLWHCPFCHQFHIGHQDTDARKAKDRLRARGIEQDQGFA